MYLKTTHHKLLQIAACSQSLVSCRHINLGIETFVTHRWKTKNPLSSKKIELDKKKPWIVEVKVCGGEIRSSLSSRFCQEEVCRLGNDLKWTKWGFLGKNGYHWCGTSCWFHMAVIVITITTTVTIIIITSCRFLMAVTILSP